MNETKGRERQQSENRGLNERPTKRNHATAATGSPNQRANEIIMNRPNEITEQTKDNHGTNDRPTDRPTDPPAGRANARSRSSRTNGESCRLRTTAIDRPFRPSVRPSVCLSSVGPPLPTRLSIILLSAYLRVCLTAGRRDSASKTTSGNEPNVHTRYTEGALPRAAVHEACAHPTRSTPFFRHEPGDFAETLPRGRLQLNEYAWIAHRQRLAATSWVVSLPARAHRTTPYCIPP